MSPTRERPRVRLRDIRPDDEQEFITRVRASRSLHRPWSHLADTHERFEELLAGAASPTESLFLIVR